MTRILVTGAAGFIGMHVAERLLARGEEVVGLDNLTPYYDVTLKEARLARLERISGFRFVRTDLADRAAMEGLFAAQRFDRVIHLAAQPGVRYSLTHPHEYIQSNIVGMLHVLEGCRHHGVAHLTYASSSSVYGSGTRMPFSVHEGVDHPMSLYAATKKSNELMAHTYSHLYDLPTTGLRFFTVYGPWGRPDMAPFIFTRAVLEGKPIDVFNHGKMRRDFTFVDDIAEGVVRTNDRVAEPDPAWDSANPDPATSRAPYRVYNIGSHEPVELMRFIEVIEACTGKRAVLNMRPAQPGDMEATFADVDDLVRDVGFRPSTKIEVGMERFVKWYREFYGV